MQKEGKHSKCLVHKLSFCTPQFGYILERPSVEVYHRALERKDIRGVQNGYSTKWAALGVPHLVLRDPASGFRQLSLFSVLHAPICMLHIP